VDHKEYFVPFDDYPVFNGASRQQIFQMQRLSPTQLHWPDLDADRNRSPAPTGALSIGLG
jgi:hypothetical protein